MNELFDEEVPRPRQNGRANIPAPIQSPTLKTALADFCSNLSPCNKGIRFGTLAAAALLVLLFVRHVRGGTDNMMTMIWVGAIVVFGVVEAVTAGLVSIWFVAGALAAMLAAVGGLSVLAQIVAFIAVSALALAVTRPLVRKFTTGRAIPTNLDRVVGETGKVTETIDNENSTGAVYVEGKTWTARSADGGVIPAEMPVRIVKIEGVKLFVEKIKVTEGTI